MTPPKTSAPPVSPAHSASSTDGGHKRGGMPNNRRSRLGSPLFSRKSASSAAHPTINTSASQSGSAPGSNATTPSGMNTKRRSESQLIVSPRVRGAQNMPKKKLSVDFSEGALSVTQSPKRQSPRRSPGVLGPFLTGPLATDYSDAPQQQQKTAVDEAMQLDAAGLVFPTVPAFVDTDVAEEASPGAVHGAGGDFAPYPTEERARVVSTCESDASSVMYAASNATQENYGWANEQQQQQYYQQQQQQDAYGQQQAMYQNGYPQDPNGYNGAMVDASYGANASYADVVSRQRSGSVAMVRSHDTFDSLSEGMVESMSRILSKTNGGRTHNEVQLACLIQKIQTHLKIMGQVSGGIRADYYETASKLKQVLAEKRMLEAHNQELQERIQQLDQDRQYFQMHVLQFQQSQSAILQDSFGHLSQSVAEAKQATLDLGARMSYEIAEASRNGGSGAVAGGNSSHLEAKVDRLTQAVLDQRNHAAAAAASTVASKLPPHQSLQSHPITNASAPASSGWKGPSFLLVGGGLLFWGVSIASVYFGAKSLAIAEFQEQQPQVVSPALVASDLDMIVDRITQRLQRDGHVAKPLTDMEVDELKLDEILDNWKAPFEEEEPKETRELEQQPQIEMTEEIHDIVVDEVTSFIETEMAQPEQIEVAPVDVIEDAFKEEEVVLAPVDEPTTHSDSDDEVDDLHVADLEQADAIAAEEEYVSADASAAVEAEETVQLTFAEADVTPTEESAEIADLGLPETLAEISEVEGIEAEMELRPTEFDEVEEEHASDTMIEAVVPADLSFADVEVSELLADAAIDEIEAHDSHDSVDPIVEITADFEKVPENDVEPEFPIDEQAENAESEDAAHDLTSADSEEVSEIVVAPVDAESVAEDIAELDENSFGESSELEDLRETDHIFEDVFEIDEEPIAEELVLTVDPEEPVAEEPVFAEVTSEIDEVVFADAEVESFDIGVDSRTEEEPVADMAKEITTENDEEVKEDDESVIAGVILNPLARLAEALKSSTEFVFGSPDSVTLDDNEVVDEDYEPSTTEENNASGDIEESFEAETEVTDDAEVTEVPETEMYTVDEVESAESEPEAIETTDAAADINDGISTSDYEPGVLVEHIEEIESSFLAEAEEVKIADADSASADELESIERSPIFHESDSVHVGEILTEAEVSEPVSIIEDEEVSAEPEETDNESADTEIFVESDEKPSMSILDASLDSAMLEVAVDSEEHTDANAIETVVVGVEGDIVDVTEAPVYSFLSSEVEPESSEEETIFYINQDDADEFPFLIESVDGEAEVIGEEPTIETEDVLFAEAHEEAHEGTFEAVEDATGSVLIDQASDDFVAESTADSSLEADIFSSNANEQSEHLEDVGRLAEEPAEELTHSEANAENELDETVDVVVSEESVPLAEVNDETEIDIQVDVSELSADDDTEEVSVSVEESDMADVAEEIEALTSTDEEPEAVAKSELEEVEEAEVDAESESEEVADLTEDIEANDTVVDEVDSVVGVEAIPSIDPADDSSDESSTANDDVVVNVVEPADTDAIAVDVDTETITVEVVADAADVSDAVEAAEVVSDDQLESVDESAFEASSALIEVVAAIAEVELEADVATETPLEEVGEQEIEESADATAEVESDEFAGEKAEVTEGVAVSAADASVAEEQEANVDAVIESEPEAVIEAAYSEVTEALEDEEAAADAEQEEVAVETPDEDLEEVAVVSEEPVADIKPTSFFGF